MPHCALPSSLGAVLPDEAAEVCEGDCDHEEANEESESLARLAQSRHADPGADCEWGYPMMGQTQSMTSGISYVAPMESMLGPRMSKLRTLHSKEFGTGSESESGDTHDPGSMVHNVSEVTSMMSKKSSLGMASQPSNTSSCSGGSTCSPSQEGALSLDDQKQRWLQRKERIRKKKLCGETYGNLVRNEYGSDCTQEQVQQICAQHGFHIGHVKLLGSGSFARVWRGKLVAKLDSLPRGQKVAVKVTRDRFSNSTSVKRWLEREVKTMMVARHENLVHLYKAFISQNSSTVLCMEYCGGGTVHGAVHGDLTFSLSTEQRVKILADIAEGMVFLHSSQIIHRDLKPANVLLKSKLTGCDDRPHAKVCDFGLSRLLAEGAPTHQTMDVGTPVYRAPEINSSAMLLCSRTYTVKADVYSYAILVNEVLTEKHPFQEHRASASKLMALLAKNTRPSEEGIPDDTPATLLDIMRRGWQMIPEERPDFAEIATALQARQDDAVVSI